MAQPRVPFRRNLGGIEVVLVAVSEGHEQIMEEAYLREVDPSVTTWAFTLRIAHALRRHYSPGTSSSAFKFSK